MDAYAWLLRVLLLGPTRRVSPAAAASASSFVPSSRARTADAREGREGVSRAPLPVKDGDDKAKPDTDGGEGKKEAVHAAVGAVARGRLECGDGEGHEPEDGILPRRGCSVGHAPKRLRGEEGDGGPEAGREDAEGNAKGDEDRLHRHDCAGGEDRVAAHQKRTGADEERGPMVHAVDEEAGEGGGAGRGEVHEAEREVLARRGVVVSVLRPVLLKEVGRHVREEGHGAVPEHAEQHQQQRRDLVEGGERMKE